MPKRRRRLDPILMEEMVHALGEGPEDPVWLLVAAGMFRDDMPWLYELAVDAYRAATEGAQGDVDRAMGRLLRTTETFARGAFPPEAFGIDPRDAYMLFEVLRRAAPRVSARVRRPPRKRRPEPAQE
jgi:hypothetical protein